VNIIAKDNRQETHTGACQICGATSLLRHIPFNDGGPHANEIFQNLNMLACEACDSMWVIDPPTNEQLGSYYSTDYTPGRMAPVAKDQWPIWDTRSASLLLYARLFTEFRPGDLFVDIGPGNGSSLSLAPMMLPSPRIGCVEFNERSIAFFKRHIPGIEVHQSVQSFIDRHGEGAIKMIYSAHSFEHFRIDGLKQEFATIHRALANDGVMTIELPYAPAAKSGLARRHSPHLLFFSDRGFSQMLERSGFEVLFCRVVVGRTKPGAAYAAENYKTEGAKGALAAALAFANSGDFITRDVEPAKALGYVIKCVVRKAR